MDSPSEAEMIALNVAKYVYSIYKSSDIVYDSISGFSRNRGCCCDGNIYSSSETISNLCALNGWFEFLKWASTSCYPPSEWQSIDLMAAILAENTEMFFWMIEQGCSMERMETTLIETALTRGIMPVVEYLYLIKTPWPERISQKKMTSNCVEWCNENEANWHAGIFASDIKPAKH